MGLRQSERSKFPPRSGYRAHVLFRDLGRFMIEVDELEVPLPGRRLGSVLALLVAQTGQSVSADALIEATWGERPPARAPQALETVVWRLRGVLEPGRAAGAEATLLRRDAVGYRLHVPADSVDSHRFTDAARTAVETLSGGDAVAALTESGRALALWRGEPYQSVPDAEWMTTVREGLAARRVELAECHVQALLDTGQPELAIGELTPLLVEHPFRERFWAQRMLALYRSGRQADALAAYAEARRVLDTELGIEPGPELRDLHEQVLMHARSLDRAPARKQFDLTAVPVRLPRRRSAPVGRDADTAAVGALLAEGSLVTLVGPGGVGKTRLAVEVGYRLRSRYPDGVWFLDLTEVRTADGTPERVADEIAGLLGLTTRPGVASAELVGEYLADRRLLLVLDNCEHLVDAAAAVVDDLIDRGVAASFLATSREPLEVADERTFDVVPLPDEYAVHLFVERLSNLRPDLDGGGADHDTISRICEAVGGLPLGIELAAARARVFELAEVADSLSEGPAGLAGRGRGPARHASMLDTVDWSYRLTRPEEQALHRRLAVIPGSVTLDAAGALCEPRPLIPGQAPELLAGLVHRSLLTSTRPSRPDGVTVFRQLVPTRAHALRQLDEAERVAVINARDAWVCRSIRQAPLDGQPGQAQATAWVDDNIAAIRATLASTLVAAPTADGPELVVRLMLYWFEHGQMREALRWSQAAVDAAAAGSLTGYDAAIATALDGCAHALIQDRATGMRILADVLPALAAAPDDRAPLAAEVLIRVAIGAWVCLNPAVGTPAADAALALAQRLATPQLVARASAVKAMHLLLGGDPEGARALTDAVLSDPDANQFAVFVAAYTNAKAAQDVGDAPGGLRWMGRLAGAHRTLRMYPTSELLEDVAQLLDADGNPAEAVRCYAAAAALHARDGLPWPRLPYSPTILQHLSRDLPEVEYRRLWEAGQRLGRDGDPATLLDEWFPGS